MDNKTIISVQEVLSMYALWDKSTLTELQWEV